jgi:hypothetical protein
MSAGAPQLDLISIRRCEHYASVQSGDGGEALFRRGSLDLRESARFKLPPNRDYKVRH